MLDVSRHFFSVDEVKQYIDILALYKLNTLLGLAEAVAAGVGLALLPCFVGAAMTGLARLCPPLPELSGELWLLTHPDLRNTARVRAFIDFVRERLRHYGLNQDM